MHAYPQQPLHGSMDPSAVLLLTVNRLNYLENVVKNMQEVMLMEQRVRFIKTMSLMYSLIYSNERNNKDYYMKHLRTALLSYMALINHSILPMPGLDSIEMQEVTKICTKASKNMTTDLIDVVYIVMHMSKEEMDAFEVGQQVQDP